jgi:hypothetical protein
LRYAHWLRPSTTARFAEANPQWAGPLPKSGVNSAPKDRQSCRYGGISLTGNPKYRHLRARDYPSAVEVKMQVLCKKTNGNAETHCCVCGQGFVIFWDRQSRTERIAAMHEIQHVLRNHHRNKAGPEAHPQDSYAIPEWNAAGIAFF